MALIKVITYVTRTKKIPFSDWLNDLDANTQSVILKRLTRLPFGHYGDCKQLKNAAGIWELKIDYGPGYRVYLGKKGNMLVILLLGGSKGSQDRDIAKAQKYWLEYKDLKDE